MPIQPIRRISRCISVANWNLIPLIRHRVDVLHFIDPLILSTNPYHHNHHLVARHDLLTTNKMPPPAFDMRQTTSAGSSTSKRPAAPISAGAFAFSLGGETPKRAKPNPAKLATTPLRTPYITPSKEIKRTSHPQSRLIDDSAPGTSLVTPKKTLQTLDSLPPPLNITPQSALKNRNTHKPLHSLLDVSSPFRPKCESTSESKGEKLIRLGEITRGRVEEIPRERVKREDEGIGVSPRKPKGMKWSGKG